MAWIKTKYMTCEACPTQWEGHLNDGRMFYIRYRHSRLTIDVSSKKTDDVWDAIDYELGGVELYAGYPLEPRNANIGVCNWEEVRNLANFLFMGLRSLP